MSEEIWKPIVGYEGTYEVSDHGRVRRALTAPYARATKAGRILAAKSTEQYARVTLRCMGSRAVDRRCIHRLVAEAFLGPARKCAQVNHKDGNKQNNRASNLEWCTPQENVAHAWRVGLCAPLAGERHGQAKLREVDIPTVRAARDRGVPLKWIASVFGVTESAISAIHRRQSWRKSA